MTPLESVWEADRFREAVRELLSLGPDLIEEVRQSTEEGFEVPSDDDKFQLESEGLRLAFAAARTLYELQRDETDSDVVAELQRLVAAAPNEFPGIDIGALEAPLRTLVAPRPAFDRSERISAVEQLALPSLEMFGLFLDVRVAYGADGGLLEVPVFLARMNFDEPIQSGAAVSFQLAPSDIEMLREEIAQAESLLEKWREQSGGERHSA